jgi:hypothetical protein
MDPNQQLKFALKTIISLEISKLNPYCFDYDNISNIITDYGFDFGPMYYVVDSGGNSDWSIGDVNTISFDKYDSAWNYFHYSLRYISDSFLNHLNVCLERLLDNSRELIDTDYIYLDILFTSSFPEGFYYKYDERGNSVVDFYSASVYLTVNAKHSKITVQNGLDCKRPCRFDFLGYHKIHDLCKKWHIWKNKNKCIREHHEALDGYLFELVNKLAKCVPIKLIGEYRYGDQYTKEDLETNEEEESYYSNLLTGTCKCKDCKSDSEDDIDLTISESEDDNELTVSESENDSEVQDKE